MRDQFNYYHTAGSTNRVVDGAPIHFAHTGRACLNVGFPGQWIGREGLLRAALPLLHSPDLMPLDFSLALCEIPGAQPQSEYVGWTQGTDHFSNCRCYKGHVTVRLAGGGL
jgi:hypothetical protein